MLRVTVSELYRRHGLDLKPHARGAKGEELCGPCPVCGGKDRFLVFPEQNDGAGSWWCRNCEHGGDAAEFLVWCDGMPFKDAARELGMEERAATSGVRSVEQPKTRATRDVISEKDTSDPNVDAELWISAATKFASVCHEALMANQEALDYLAGRGLDADAVARYRLGWNAGENDRPCKMRWRKSWGIPDSTDAKGQPRTRLWLPQGIVIPAFGKDGQVTRLRIRRPDADRKASLPDLKYYVVPGSTMRPMWLPVENPFLPSVRVAVVVEAELDAMLVHHKAAGMVSVLGSMTAKISSLPPDIMRDLEGMAMILVATDADDASHAGFAGWEKWRDTFANARHWPCVGGKDPGEMVAGGDIFEWVLAGFPRVDHAIIRTKRAERQACSLAGAAQCDSGQPDQTPEAAPESGERDALETAKAAGRALNEGGLVSRRAMTVISSGPADAPEGPALAADGLSESQRRRQAVARQTAVLQAERRAFPLSGTYLSMDLLMTVLRAYGLRLVPAGNDVRLDGWTSLPESERSQVCGFLQRHRFMIDILSQTLNQGGNQ